MMQTLTAGGEGMRSGSGHGRAQEAADEIDIVFADRGAGREDERALQEIFGARQQQLVVWRERSIRLHAMATGIEIAPRVDVLLPERVDDRVARRRGALVVDLDDDVLIVRPVAIVVLEHANRRNAGESGAVALVVRAVHVDELLDALEVRDPHRRGDLAHLPVRADRDDVVVAGEPEVRHQPHLPRERRVIRSDRAAFERVEELRCVKAEDLRRAEVADHHAAARAAECVRRVEEQRELVTLRNARQRLDVAQLQRLDRDLQRDRRVADGDDVLHAEPGGESLFELVDERTGIREPAAIEQIVEARHQSIAIADVRTSDVQLFFRRAHERHSFLLMTRAGTPYAITSEGMSSTTTAPAPMIVLLPTLHPSMIVAPAPIHDAAPTRTRPERCAPGAICTPSSIAQS